MANFPAGLPSGLPVGRPDGLPSGRELFLEGCELFDGDGNVAPTWDPLRVAAGDYLLIMHTADPVLNGGFPQPTRLFDFGLGNDGDVVGLRCGGVEIDRVDFTEGFPIGPGHALSLDAGFEDPVSNDDGARWWARFTAARS